MAATEMAEDRRAVCPTPVERPCMVHRWDHLTFLHWSYEPAAVQRLLPPGLAVETFEGRAWVGLVPFVMQVRPPHVAPIPWLSNFPETNVRTYVTAPDGSSGVWFLSLDASRLAAVLTARSVYRLPYFWSQMQATNTGPVWRYECRRRWPDPRPAASQVEVVVGEPLERRDLSDLEHWLTARWTLFSRFPRSLWRARAHHPPWDLHRAEVTHLDDGLVTAAGLSAPAGEPLVHHSSGTEVNISVPRRVA
jgi:uncharacterized protein YqjF (DUF2071 family)